MREITVKTGAGDEVVDLTDKVQEVVSEEDFEEGICHLHITHTTASLTTADLDPGTDKDMIDAFREMVPNLNYRHPHNPEHTPDHILSTLIGTDVSVPVKAGKLVLGTWQRIVLFEWNGPRERKIVVSCLS